MKFFHIKLAVAARRRRHFRMRLVPFLAGWIMLCIPNTGWTDAAAPLGTSESQIWHLAEKEQGIYEQSISLFRHTQIDAYLDQMVSRLIERVATDLPRVEIRILEDPALKAFAYPNGIIYLSTGMLTHTQNEDELAAIIAHEMVHYLERHALSAFDHLQLPPRSTEPLPLDSHGARYSDLQSLCHAAEKQADEQGLAMVRAAGYRPQEMWTVLARFESIEKKFQAAGSNELMAQSDWQMRMHRIQDLLDIEPESEFGSNTAPLSMPHLIRIAPALLANARAAIRLGMWNQAMEDLDTYSKMIKNDALAFYMQGKIYEQGRTDHIGAAEQAYQRAIELKPDFAPAHLSLGMINYKAGNHGKARNYFKTGLALAPKSKESAYVQLYLKKCLE